MGRRIVFAVLAAAWLATVAGSVLLAHLAGPRADYALAGLAGLNVPATKARPVHGVPHAASINAAARRAGLEPALVAAVVAVESRFVAHAVSARGARGLMQLMPGTWRETAPHPLCPAGAGESCIFDPVANVDAGSRYLRRLVDRFDGSVLLALAAYNAGPSRVRATGGTRPYAETVRYLRQVAVAREVLHRSGTLPPGWQIALTAVGGWERLRGPLAATLAAPLLVWLGWLLRTTRRDDQDPVDASMGRTG